MEFTKPEPFNGATFTKECEKANVIVENFYDNGEGSLVITADSKLKTTITELLKNHDGSNTSPTTMEKLEAAGISLDELRSILGL